jgi:bleomycin hydrolase
MGEPPATVKWENKNYSPVEFAQKILKLDPNNYVDFMSLMSQPFYTQAEYDVPDNWWNDKTYYNLPVDDFMAALKFSLKNDYSVSIGGDVSEPGWDSWNNVAVIPTFDIPAGYIDDAARQIRFANGSTTDDHAMHLVGYTEQDGKTWFLFKDSDAGSRNCGAACPSFGYVYVSEDYVKLKMMTFTVNKNTVKGYLDKFAMK